MTIEDLESWAENAERQAKTYRKFAENARSDSNFRRGLARRMAPEDATASATQAELAALGALAHDIYDRMAKSALKLAEYYDSKADEMEASK